MWPQVFTTCIYRLELLIHYKIRFSCFTSLTFLFFLSVCVFLTGTRSAGFVEAGAGDLLCASQSEMDVEGRESGNHTGEQLDRFSSILFCEEHYFCAFLITNKLNKMTKISINWAFWQYAHLTHSFSSLFPHLSWFHGKTMSKMQKHQQEALWEFVHTELSYINKLKIIKDVRCYWVACVIVYWALLFLDL